MKDRSDFELEQTRPTSIKEMVESELAFTTYKGKTYPKPESIDEIMERVMQRVEAETLLIYKSKEPWALKAWALSTVFKDTLAQEVANEEAVSIANEFISPILEWQDGQPFDPIDHFMNTLERKSHWTKDTYKRTAARFVAKIGRRRYYADEDVETYLRYASKMFPNKNSYHQECRKVILFLRSLPDPDRPQKSDRNRVLPAGMPERAKKKDMYRPIISLEDIETLVWACVLDHINPNMVIRLVGATVYGRRRSELTEFKVHLDGANSTILFPTRKGGEEEPHPLPQSLVPLFPEEVAPMDGYSIHRKLRTICKNAGVNLPRRGGYHSFRRRVASTIRKVASDINAHRFMRWSVPRELTMLDLYDETPYEETDKEILQRHPIVRMWEEAIPYILKFNKKYELMNCNYCYRM